MNKKIMFVISDIEIGGAERILIFLANFLIKKKFKVRILYFKKKNSRCFNLNPKISSECLNLEKETNNIFQKIQYNYIRIKRIRKKINVYRPDYIISFLTTVNILSIIASFNLNKKLIINERNDLNKKKIPYIWKFLRFLLYRFSNKVLFNHPSSNKVLEKFVPSKKILFIPNPCMLKGKVSLKNKTKTILFVGRLTYQKNVNLLIKSFYKSCAVKKGWKLIIFGYGEELNFLKNEIQKLGINQHVIFKGISNKINEWYAKSSIYIICSRYEGMPNTLIESMYYKLAIIGTRIPGIQYFIRHKQNGLLINNNNENDLIKNLNLLINNKKIRIILGSNAQKTIIKKGNKKHFQEAWIKILK